MHGSTWRPWISAASSRTSTAVPASPGIRAAAGRVPAPDAGAAGGGSSGIAPHVAVEPVIGLGASPLVEVPPRLLALTVLFVVAEGLAGTLLAEPSLVASALLSAAFATLVVVANRVAARDRAMSARIVAFGVYLLGFAGSVLVPSVALACAMLPLLSIVLVLAFDARRSRVAIMGFAFAASTSILLAGAGPHPLPPLRAPLDTVFPFAIGLAVAVLLVSALVDFASASRQSLDSMEAALRRQQALFDGSFDAMLVADDERRFTDANPAAVALLGVPQSEIVGQPISRFYQPEQGSAGPIWHRFIAAGRQVQRVVIRRPDGQARTVDVASRANVSPGQHLTVWRDVTDEVRVEAERAMLAEAIGQTIDAVAILDPSRRIAYANAAFGELVDRPAESIVGRRIQDVTAIVGAAGDPAAAGLPEWCSAARSGPWNGDIALARPDGTEMRVAMSISPLRLDTMELAHYVLIARDVTRLRKAEATIVAVDEERRVIAKALQELGPHETPDETARAICETIVRLPGVDFAAIDAFEGPDRLLVLAACGSPVLAGEYIPPDRAAALRARAADGPWAEWWGDRTDEFGSRLTAAGVKAVALSPIVMDSGPVGLLLIGTSSDSYAPYLVERLPAAVEFTSTARALLGPALEARRDEVVLRARIERLIAEHAFRPVYQPIVRLHDSATIGYEALTRFDGGTRPDEVFAAARRTGLWLELEVATLDAAIRASAGLPPGAWLSLNVSPALVTSADVLGPLLAGCARPIVLEVTEHEVIEDYGRLRDGITRLGANVRVAVDDTGAGVANFNHLIELRPQFVKIDAGLIRGIDTDIVRQGLLVGLRHFAAVTGADVIAEGIETEAERLVLANLGVHLGQGYLMARPAPAETWATASPATGGRPVRGVPARGTSTQTPPTPSRTVWRAPSTASETSAALHAPTGWPPIVEEPPLLQ